jgi:preprotein translocase subunit SecA
MAEKSILLQLLDQAWKDHLLTLDHLRQGISLRAYAQRDPLREYQAEAFNLFEEMLSQLREDVTRTLSTVELRVARPEEMQPRRPNPEEIRETREDPAMAEAAATGTYGGGMAAAAAGGGGAAAAATGMPVRNAPPPGIQADPNDPETWGKVPRNAPCPCGSGKKYKHCHGSL